MLVHVWIYTFISVLIVSLIAFVGIFTISLKARKLNKFLIYMVSFAAGALVGDVFIYLLPEAVEKFGFGLDISLYILLGLVSMFIVEKFVRWHHCHQNKPKKKIKPYAITNLVGDGVHNFIDGLIIGASYLVSIPVGVATTLAVVFHEIPQEMGDFAVLVHGGFSRNSALLFNFLTAMTAVLGAVVALLVASVVESVTIVLIPLAAGHFIYIAVADLIPELHKETAWKKSVAQLFFFLLGIAIMFSLLLL